MSRRGGTARAGRVALLATVFALATLAAAPSPAAGDFAVELERLGQQLAALEADPVLADMAGLERWKARQAMSDLAAARSRDRNHALYIARARVAAAEQAAQAEVLRAQSAQLDAERDQILLEGSRREAEAARREADALRRQAMAREEEAQREAETMAAERAALEQSSAQADAAAEQALKLADARAEETRLARKDVELAAALAADSAASGKAAPPPPSRRVGSRTVYTLPGSAFASGSATLAPSAIASLRSLFSAIGAKKGLRVEAHTDSQGPEAANLSLSQQRADAVRRALVEAGIAGKRITAVGKGEATPVVDNGSAEGRARNRRVEIVVE